MHRRLPHVLLAIFLVATALLLPVGCGDDEGDDTSSTVSGGTEPTATEDTSTQTTTGGAATTESGTSEGSQTTTGGGAEEGSAIFAAQCSPCHGASGEGGGAGPALQTRTDLDKDAVEEQVREGGNGMPAFEGNLSDDQIEAVSQYVTDEIVQK